MFYEIKENPQYNRREVYFGDKPKDNIRKTLKSLKMRWNYKKKCWYGYATEREIVDAILDASAAAEDSATIRTDGYMGGGAIYGSKSNRMLFGADLSAAIRTDIKNAGIKRCTVRCNSYSGGQHLYVTIKTTPEDVIGRDEFVQRYKIKDSFPWIEFWNKEGMVSTLHIDTYYNMSRDEQEAIRISAAQLDYHQTIESECNLNHYYLGQYCGFSHSGTKKIEAVRDIIEAYRYDNSNAMVDYFDTNFYFTIITKPGFSIETLNGIS